MQSPYRDSAAALRPVAAATPAEHRKVTWKLFPSTELKHGRTRAAVVRDLSFVPVETL